MVFLVEAVKQLPQTVSVTMSPKPAVSFADLLAEFSRELANLMLRKDPDTGTPKKIAVQGQRPPIVADRFSEETCAHQDSSRDDHDYI